MAQDVFFTDRAEAGQKLAVLLQPFKGRNPIVFAMTRGGVPVGKEIARQLQCPLEPLIIRKIGHPSNPEYAIGAIAEDGTAIFNETEIASVSKKWLEAQLEKQKLEIQKRCALYSILPRGIPIKDKTVIIVDDGIATGLSMFVAIEYIKKQKPARIVVAVPVAPKDTAIKIRQKVDKFVTVAIPDYYLGAVGAYYSNFVQVSDEEVKRILE